MYPCEIGGYKYPINSDTTLSSHRAKPKAYLLRI
jgi:hypothetical protein